jgi:hypothetical protein
MSWRCPNCGIINTGAGRCNYCQEPMPADAKASAASGSGWTVIQWYRAVLWVIGGLFCIGIGVMLMVNPTFRADPRVLTLSDLLPGVGAVVVGVVMLGLVAFVRFRRR